MKIAGHHRLCATSYASDRSEHLGFAVIEVHRRLDFHFRHHYRFSVPFATTCMPASSLYNSRGPHLEKSTFGQSGFSQTLLQHALSHIYTSLTVSYNTSRPIYQPTLDAFRIMSTNFQPTPEFQFDPGPTSIPSAPWPVAPTHPVDIPRRSIIFIAIAATFTFLATICVALRFFSRFRKSIKCWWDDWLILIALVSAHAFLATVILSMTLGGAGYHIMQYTPSQIQAFLEVSYHKAFQILSLTSTLRFGWRTASFTTLALLLQNSRWCSSTRGYSKQMHISESERASLAH